MLIITIFLTFFFLVVTSFILNRLSRERRGFPIKRVVRDWIVKTRGNHLRIRKGLKIVGLSSLIGLYSFGCYNIANRITFIRFPNGDYKWINTNGEQYLYLKAEDHYSLGYLMGRALASEIWELKTILLFQSVMTGRNYFDAISIGRSFLPFIPEKYQQEILGISDGATAGQGLYVSFDDILLQTLFFEILYGQKFLDVGGGCTTFIAKNNDSIIGGQNIDLFNIIGQFGTFILLELSDETKIFCYAIGAGILPIAKGNNNISTMLNLVELKDKAPICRPLFVSMRESFRGNSSLYDFNRTFFSEGKTPYGMNLIVSDGQDFLGIQSNGNNQSYFEGNDLVFSNTFLDAYWQEDLKDENYSKDRQLYGESELSGSLIDGYFSSSELTEILGDKTLICRESQGLLETSTVAFLTRDRFGLGNINGAIGDNPF